MARRICAIVAALVSLTAAAGCVPDGPEHAVLPQGSEPVSLEADDFVSTIDNAYWPMRPGSRWVYRETDAEGTVTKDVVTVLPRTKTILGIRAAVVHDLATVDGKPVEDTYDWYGQDEDGNLWYLGEDTKELENGKVVSTEGSWEAGVEGAQPGIALPAQPKAGLGYRQEYLRGVAEDAGRVLSVARTMRVPFGRFADVLETKDYSPLEPKVVEHKFYAKGVGPVSAVTVSGGSDHEVLLRYTAG